MFVNYVPFRVSGESLEVLVDNQWIEVHSITAEDE